jgi:hypothetical protein
MPYLDEFKQVLNPNIFTIDSLEGVFVICLVIFAIYAIGRRMIKATTYCLMLLIFIQILYGLSLTAFNDVIPISNIIKYDVIAAVAQIFAGTFISDWLLYISAFIMWLTSHLGNAIAGTTKAIIEWFAENVLPMLDKR